MTSLQRISSIAQKKVTNRAFALLFHRSRNGQYPLKRQNHLRGALRAFE
jgi:hypothetical protein